MSGEEKAEKIQRELFKDISAEITDGELGQIKRKIFLLREKMYRDGQTAPKAINNDYKIFKLGIPYYVACHLSKAVNVKPLAVGTRCSLYYAYGNRIIQ